MDHRLGYQFVPFTFPTVRVTHWLNEWYPYRIWTWDFINQAHDWYQSAVESGLPPFDESKGVRDPVVKFIAEKMGAFPPEDIANYLTTLARMVREGKMNPEYFTVTPAPASTVEQVKDVVTAPARWFGETADKSLQMANTIKWIAIAGAVLVGFIYLGPPVSKILKARK